MAEVNYAWGSERPSARRTRLKHQIEAAQALKAAAALEYERKLAEIAAIEAVRVADLNEVDLMTSGGAAPYNRDLEADPQVAGRTRVENTQALYGRGRKLVRSTLPTQVVKAGETARDARKGVKATGRKTAGRPNASRVAPSARSGQDMDLTGSSAQPAGLTSQGPVDVAPQSEIVVPNAVLATPETIEAVATVPEVPAYRPPPISAALEASVFLAMGDIDAPESDEMIEVLTTTDKVIDVFSPAVLAERAARRDPSRLPPGYDPTWADHWQRDPDDRLAEMVAEFPTFGAATDKSPDLLTDDEARVLAGSALFRLTGNQTVADYAGKTLPPIYSQLTDLDPALWRREIARGGGTLQKLVAGKRIYIDPFREIERSRVRMWPLAVSRRDAVKSYMEALAVGEMTFEPASDAKDDLDRSVRYQVFRGPDHDWVGLPSRLDLEIYYTRILDKLPWPAGLSRIELVERFGQGMGPTEIQNLSLLGRPPAWLLSDKRWDDITSGVIDLGNGETVSLEDGEFETADSFGSEGGLAPVVPFDPDAPEPEASETDES
jgi:hypothetical protein